MSRCPLPFLLGIFTLLLAAPLPAQTEGSAATLQQADAAADKHNYREAATLYEQLLQQEALPDGVTREELVFRQANASWRNLIATRQSDPQLIEAPRETLQELAEKLHGAAQGKRPPQLWADIQESLGDSYWVSEQFRDWGQAWPHYQKTLEWWAASTEIDAAREHYLEIVFRAARPPQVQPYWRYGNYNNWIPENVLRNAIQIAVKPADKAHANYLLATSQMRQWGEPAMKAGKHFEAAIEEGKGTPWADDALFQYAQWAERFGSSYWDENGNFVVQSDFPLALKLYRQLVDTYKEGESRYWRQAKNRIENITSVSLSVNVHQSFLPGSVVEFDLGWRNIDEVVAEVYAIDLAEAFQPDEDNANASPFDNYEFDLAGKTPAVRLTRKANDQAYTAQHERITLEEALEPGAYVIQAKGGKETAQGLLLVTSQQLTVFQDGDAVVAWPTDAQTSQPTAEAQVTVWLGRDYREGNERKMEWLTAQKASGEDGLTRFTASDFPNAEKDFGHYDEVIVISQREGQVSAASGRYYYGYNHVDGQWRVYAFTDRPAYRPGDTVHWKATARVRQGFENWRVPNGEKLRYQIQGPQGEEVAKGVMDLNEYGSTWGELTAEQDWKLGMYRVEFRRASDGDFIGRADLFRLEEYKLPEFKVSVSTAKEDGEAATAYRLGDEVEIEIKADYYFGGAVANADVQVQVRQNPYYHYWRPPSPYPWYDAMREPPRHYGGGQIVLNETLKTDAEGRATLTLPTDDYQQDTEFSIEARVVDESRREVVGQASIRVTRAPYFVYLNPERTLYQPGETATVKIKTINANDEPVEVEGRLRLTREEWMQVWRGPDGEEISGQEFDRRRQKGSGLFSSALDPSKWKMIRQGYDVEEINVTNIRTNAEGEATFEFTVPKTGYYRVYWVSRPERMAPIKRDTAVWVADSASQNIGYHGELKIVADEEAFREGRRAPVMITTPEQGRWVLFSVQGAGLIDTRVVYLEGNVKLIECDVDDRWIPNVWLQANANYQLRTHQDRVAINVPPEKHFIDVTVTPNAETYQPREQATAMITTRDVHGRPVPAEVAFSVFDEAVLAIQPTLAPDPREFFYGELRRDVVRTFTSQQQRRLTEVQKVAKAEKSAQIPQPASVTFGGRAAGGMMMADHAFDAAAAPMMEANRAMDPFSAPTAKMDADGGGAAAEPAVVVRHDFRATVVWKPAVVTDANGQATVEFEWPDNVTTWNLEARAVGLPSKFGEGESQAKTRLPLIARLQTPRFLVTGDEVTLTGVINNNLGESVSANASLEVEGGLKMKDSASQSIDVPANGSTQVNWTANVVEPGDAKITLTVRGAEHADAMELTISVFEHGIDKFIARSGKMSAESLKLTMDLPKFKPEGASFTLHLSPSIATTMLDALPYLAQYPYGCTEQTMSRFLPAVIVAQTLSDLGLPADKIMQENFGGIEASTPEEIYLKNKPHQNGDLSNLDDMVLAGMKRLQDFQHSDGGWGWWKRGDSDDYMSAYVVWGLTLAHQAGRDVDGDMLEKGRNYLGLRLVEYEERYDMQAWLLHALASEDRGQEEPKPDKQEARAFANLWKNRDQLNAYTRALTALSAHWLGFEDEARILAENLANGVKLDENPQGSILLPQDAQANTVPQNNETILKTAHWGEDGVYWRWSNGGVEATAFVLMAMSEITPESGLIEPTMNWLVKNRRGAQWSNTRDTAIVVLALNAWLRQSGELEASGEYTAMLNGEAVGEISVTPETVLTAPRALKLPTDRLKEGSNEIALQRKVGDAPLYFSARFNFFTLEDPIAPAGNELFVNREYQRTYPVKTLLDGYDLKSQSMQSGDSADSGDRIEAIITVEAKNNLEYLLIEDLKPAGFEAVELQSGGNLYARELRPGKLDHEQERYTGRQRWVYQELRDRQVACFIDKLPQGLWEIRYELRAETPGEFSALPVLGEAMYVPEIKANSAEFKVTVRDE